ncbi:hypothetical protein YPPY102_3732, partial [Yersinia pestis PY-102]
MYYR